MQQNKESARAIQHGRFGALDGLRGVAAVIVVLHHLGNERLGPFNPTFGYIAVDLFFALSGFVIALNYDHRFAGGMTVKEFMLKRVLRLYPLYAAGLLLSLLTISVVVNATPEVLQRSGDPSWFVVTSTTVANTFLLPGTARAVSDQSAS